MLTAFASQRKEAWPSWPLFGRQRTLNVATYCASVSGISAGQQRNGQVARTRDTVYGPDACRQGPSERIGNCSYYRSPADGLSQAERAAAQAVRVCTRLWDKSPHAYGGQP